jgi:hypothetical protein
VKCRTQVVVPFLENLPSVLISALRASGDVAPTDDVAFVRFPGVDGDFCLRLHQRAMRHGVKFIPHRFLPLLLLVDLRPASIRERFLARN